jgi:hypothetical protein
MTTDQIPDIPEMPHAPEDAPESAPVLSAPPAAPYEPPDDATLRDRRTGLELVLLRTRTRWQQPMLGEGALWYSATLVAVLLSALLLAALMPTRAVALVRWTVGIGGAAATISALAALAAWRLRRPDAVGMARLLQRHAPALRNDLVSALEFADKILSGGLEAGASEAMARRHVQRTYERTMAALERGALAHLLPKRDIAPAVVALSGGVALLLIPVLVAPDWTRSLLSGSLFPAKTQIARQTVQRPLVGAFNISYTPPGYTGMPPHQDLLTSGQLDGLAGTEVVLQTYLLDASMRTLELVVTTPDGTTIVPVEIAAGGRAVARLTLATSGSYKLRGVHADGEVVEDPTERAIAVIPDLAPNVQILSHQGELEVQPDEVLELQYSAGDDFGLAGLARVHVFAGGEDEPVRVTLDLGAAKQETSATGTIVLPLAELGLQPRDTVTLHLEATDGNTVTGPGVGRSDALVLHVSAPDERHIKNIELQQQLLEELLGSLGDYLEAPVGERVLGTKAYRQVVPAELGDQELAARLLALRQAHDTLGPVLERMRALSGELGKDPMMVPRDVTLFTALSAQLTSLHGEGAGVLARKKAAQEAGELDAAGLQAVADYAAKMEDALEKGLLRMEDLLTAQRMAAVQDTVKDIQELKDRLRGLLERYRETQDPEVKREIKREIQRLRQRLGELMQRMQSQMRELPDEHINAEALKQAELESDAKKLADSFQSIEELLDKNDIDGALKALDEMTANINSLTKDMRDQFRAAQPEGLSELDQEMSKLMDSVNQLSDMQQKVEQQTQQLQKELQEKKRNQVSDMLKDFTDQMERRIDAQERQLDELAAQDELAPHHRASVDNLKRELRSLRQDLKQQDIEASLDRSRKVQEEIEQMRFSMQLGHRYLPRGSDQARQNQENIKRASQMGEESAQMTRELQQMMERAQQMMDTQGDPRMKELAKQQRQTRERAERVVKELKQAGEKFPTIEQQLGPGMQRAQQAMREAEQGMEQGRMQRSLDAQRRAIEELRQVKESMRQALEKERSRQDGEQGREVARDKIAIPGKDKNAAGDALRKEVQRGMKEERLGDYKSDIENYYKSLLE